MSATRAAREGILARMNSSEAAPRPLAGIDIGGTKIGLVIGDSSGRVLATDRLDNEPTLRPDALLERALARLRELWTEEWPVPPAALGLACPGPLSYEGGCLLEVPNMPLWHGFGVLDYCRRASGVPVAMMNDANAGVLAEVQWGAARQAKTAIFLTMSTGMGAGLWIDGRLFEGRLALAGEIGHMRMTQEGPVGFGKRGSVEGYLSGPGMEQLARAELLACRQAGRATALHEADISPRRLCELALTGDAAALAVVDLCGERLGELCAWLVDLLNPDVIVLGTIASAFPELWLPRARAALDREALPSSAALVRLEVSGLEDRGNQTALAIAKRAVSGRH